MISKKQKNNSNVVGPRPDVKHSILFNLSFTMSSRFKTIVPLSCIYQPHLICIFTLNHTRLTWFALFLQSLYRFMGLQGSGPGPTIN